MLYVHPVISADLRQRTYGGDFSLVLPIQEPSEWVKGRGLDSEKLKTCLNNLPDHMKKKCERLIVEASQPDEVEDDDYEFWDSEDFPSYLVPLLLHIKEEIPTLKKISFIFWFGEWSAPVDVWKKSLRLLSRRWNKSQNGRENARKGLTSKSYRGKPSIEMQFNLFDYYDQDGGDGGANEYLMWYCFAGHERSGSGDERGSDLDNDDDDDDKKSDDDESQGSDEGISEDDNENEDDEDYSDDEATAKSLGLKFTFRAMDLHWEDHVQGNFEGKEFDPNVWDDGYFHTMSPKERDRAAHKYWHITETCKPLFIKKAGGPLS